MQMITRKNRKETKKRGGTKKIMTTTMVMMTCSCYSEQGRGLGHRPSLGYPLDDSDSRHENDGKRT